MKSNRLFNVISKGEILDGRDRDALVPAVIGLTGQNPDSASRLIEGKGLPAAVGLDYVRAVKLRDALFAAGLICVIEPAGKHATEEEARLPDQVVNPFLKRPNILYAPRRCIMLKHDPSGLCMCHPSPTTVRFGDIRLISGYSRATKDADNRVSLIVFVRETTRPFLIDIDKIRFGDFPDVCRSSTVETFRRFLEWILAVNPSIRIDRSTHILLRGGRRQPHDCEEEPWCASLGAALESLGTENDPGDRGQYIHRLLNGVVQTPSIIQDDAAIVECREIGERTSADCGVCPNSPPPGVTREELDAIFMLMSSRKHGKSIFEKNTRSFWFYFGANAMLLAVTALLMLLLYLLLP